MARFHCTGKYPPDERLPLLCDTEARCERVSHEMGDHCTLIMPFLDPDGVLVDAKYIDCIDWQSCFLLQF